MPVHPHVCGENEQPLVRFMQFGNSPPRVWGKWYYKRLLHFAERFTPTCVGKIFWSTPALRLLAGSPPRVWGKCSLYLRRPPEYPVHPHVCGENGTAPRAGCRHPVHPHVCGENILSCVFLAAIYGSPPRVWGKSFSHIEKSRTIWFTPTCVGKMYLRRSGLPKEPVHPHVCGENLSERTRRDPRTRFTPTCVGKMPKQVTSTVSIAGSPPRVWGKCLSVPTVNGNGRFTPTSVGKMYRHWRQPHPRPVHPHVCGENDRSRAMLRPIFGSPPRVWGKCIYGGLACRKSRFTPTCVGKMMKASTPWTPMYGSPPRVWGKCNPG